MRRLYFLLPHTQSAKAIVNELLLERVEWRHIHVLAKHDVPLEHLPEATLTQRSDLLPALARGTAAGGVVGMLAGLVALAFPPAGLTIAGRALVPITLASAGVGASVAPVIGCGVPKTRLKRLVEAVAR